jgi:hypothetical protein
VAENPSSRAADPAAAALNTSITDMLDVIDNVRVDDIAVAQDTRRPIDREKLGELTESIRQRGLLQPIGVQRLNGRYRLIWGAHRFEAWAQILRIARARATGAPDQDEAMREINRWLAIPAIVYPADLPEPMLKILEIEENLRRKELTTEEKGACDMDLAAALKELEAMESRDPPDFSGMSNAPTAGRGHKGAVQKVAERLDVDHSTVRNRVRKAAEAIGEPVDLGKDTPDELRRKADKVRTAPKRARARKPKPIDGDREPKTSKQDSAPPLRTTGTYTNSTGYVMRYTVPALSATKVEVAFLKHARIGEVADWIVGALGIPWIGNLFEALGGRIDEAATDLEAEAAERRDQAEAIPAARSTVHDDLRDRVRAVLTKLDMSETRFARHAGIPQPSLNRFMLGQRKTSKGNLAKIEAALADLAEYAGEAPA